MDTITIQIGNTDDKLSQEEWSNFYESIDSAVCQTAVKLHFSGAPPSYSRRQNACWVFDIAGQGKSDAYEELRAMVFQTRVKYGQESVAWTKGRTEFI